MKCHLHPPPKIHTPFCWTTLLHSPRSGHSAGGSAQTPDKTMITNYSPTAKLHWSFPGIWHKCLPPRQQQSKPQPEQENALLLQQSTVWCIWVSPRPRSVECLQHQGRGEGKFQGFFFPLLIIRRQRRGEKKGREYRQRPLRAFWNICLLPLMLLKGNKEWILWIETPKNAFKKLFSLWLVRGRVSERDSGGRGFMHELCTERALLGSCGLRMKHPTLLGTCCKPQDSPLLAHKSTPLLGKQPLAFNCNASESPAFRKKHFMQLYQLTLSRAVMFRLITALRARQPDRNAHQFSCRSHR